MGTQQAALDREPPLNGCVTLSQLSQCLLTSPMTEFPPQDFCKDEGRQGIGRKVVGTIRKSTDCCIHVWIGLGGFTLRGRPGPDRQLDSLAASTSLLHVLLSSGKTPRRMRGHGLGPGRPQAPQGSSVSVGMHQGLEVGPLRHPGTRKPGMSERRGQRIWGAALGPPRRCSKESGGTPGV